MNVRFVIGVPGECESGSWKLWSQSNDVYLLTRSMGSITKFSFHASGVCRWALVGDRPDRGDRAMLKWRRGPVPPAGSGRGALLLSLVFPTSHLSAYRGGFTKPIKWIPPAPIGRATKVEVFLANESVAVVEERFAARKERSLLGFGALRCGTNVAAASSHIECEPVDLKSPGNPDAPGIVFGDLAFPEIDRAGTGRPIRMLTIWPAKHEGDAPTALEIGGYEVGARKARR